MTNPQNHPDDPDALESSPAGAKAAFDLGSARETYEGRGLDEGDMAADWWDQLASWMDDAVAANLPEPGAMVVATASSEGVPSTRTVLCRRTGRSGIDFYTNYAGRKGSQLAVFPAASATFPWVGLARQVTLIGRVLALPEAESDRYFASRPRGSQIGAWASAQSTVVPGRDVIEATEREVRALYEGTDVPRPPHWGGFRLEPASVEFWQGRPNRLHDRLRYRRDPGGLGWVLERLSP